MRYVVQRPNGFLMHLRIYAEARMSVLKVFLLRPSGVLVANVRFRLFMIFTYVVQRPKGVLMHLRYHAEACMSVLKAFFAEAFRRPCSKCLISTVHDFYIRSAEA